MRASVHASIFSRTDVCLEAKGISCLPLAQAQGQAKQLLLSQKKILCLPMSLQLLEYVMCVTASDSTEIFNHWMPLEKTAKVQNYAKCKRRLIIFCWTFSLFLIGI